MASTSADAGETVSARAPRDAAQVQRYLRLLDPNAEWFTFQLFTDQENKPSPDPLAKVLTVNKVRRSVLDPYEQGHAGVWVTVNNTNGKGRKAIDITRVRAVWQEDDDGYEGEFPLEPSMVVESSPGHYHRYWLVDGDWPTDEQGRKDFAGVMARMVASYGSDKSAKDISRVLRVPGFLHRKNPKAPHMVAVVGGNGLRYTRAEILAAFPPPEKRTRPAGRTGNGEAGEGHAELVRQVLTGDNYHGALTSLAWRLIGAGVPGGQVVEQLRGLVLAIPDARHDDRWRARFAEILGLVSSAEAKQDAATPQGPSDSTQGDPPGGADDAKHVSRIAELAAMSRLKYAHERKGAAKEIGITAAALDRLVAEQRKAADAEQSQPAHWVVEPWSEEVDGAALLDAVAAVFSRYAVLPKHAGEALSLWVAHAWALDCFQCSPFVTLISPTKRCGKTRVLAILKWLAPRAELAGSISAAALFRYVEQEGPTLLIDEADRTIAAGDEMQAILNSSHKRVGAFVIRCEGEDNRPRRFSTWTPKAIATIAKLADTLQDRSVVVEMRRKLPDEKLERWNEDDTPELAMLRRKLLRWAEDQAEELRGAYPDVSDALDDRAADNWRPLLAIAEAAGGDWPARARTAAEGLLGEPDDDDPVIRLLADTRAIFAETPQADWIGSTDLAERLGRLEGSRWQEWKQGRPITPTAIARLLRRARIHPSRSAGTGGRYLKAAFEDAWKRYLPQRG